MSKRLFGLLFCASVYMQSSTAAGNLLVYPPGINVVGDVSFAGCETVDYIKAAPEFCAHPKNGSGQAFWFSFGQFTKGGYLNASDWDRKRLTCKYCRPGASNGPRHGRQKDTNVVPVGYSFLVTGANLGTGDSCDGGVYEIYDSTCPAIDVFSPGYDRNACQAACTRTWQAQTIRFTCEYTGTSNFDGDPDCDNF